MHTFLLVVAIGVAHHQAITVQAAGGFDAMHDGHGIGIADICDQHANQTGATTLEPARHLIGAITEGVDGVFDTQCDGVGKQLSILANEARHAGFGHASQCGHVIHRYAGPHRSRETIHDLDPDYSYRGYQQVLRQRL